MKTTIDEQNLLDSDQKGDMDRQSDLEKNEAVLLGDESTRNHLHGDALQVEQPGDDLPISEMDLSEEDRQAFEQQMELYKKKIICTKLSDELTHRFNDAAGLLITLDAEVISKQNQALEKNDYIKQIVQQLMHDGYIQVNEQEFKRSEESVQKYVDLLNDVRNEINQEMQRIALMQTAEEGKEFAVWKTAPDEYPVYVEQRIKQLKHYIKSVRRDLNISYSRYCFGFESQMRRIESIQRYIERVVKQRAS
ncbi:hypothetical protein JST56_02410 [Candidatus Dependentiae bacterium]|nr:hypothetical protein [Candidatus Dependentiae bacterium]